jgi:hypothetical protein
VGGQMTLPFKTLAISLAAFSVGLFVQSDAHEAKSGWTYPQACCLGNDVGGDCEAIPSSDVTKVPRGFAVILHPGDHHLVSRNHHFLIPYGDAIPSGDGEYHICLHPTEFDVNCFFAPPGSA